MMLLLDSFSKLITIKCSFLKLPFGISVLMCQLMACRSVLYIKQDKVERVEWVLICRADRAGRYTRWARDNRILQTRRYLNVT